MKKILLPLIFVLFVLIGCSKVEQDSVRVRKEFDNLSEEWLVEDNWSLKLNEIYETEERAVFKNEDDEVIDLGYDNVYILSYSYENLMSNEIDNTLKMEVKTIVSDKGEVAFNYPLINIKKPESIKSLQSCDEVEYGFSFKDKPEKIKIYFSRLDKEGVENEVIYDLRLK